MKTVGLNKDDMYLTGDDVEVYGKDTLQDEAATAGPANPSSLELREEGEQWWWVGFFLLAACSFSTFCVNRE